MYQYHLPTHFPDLSGAKLIAVDVETCDPNLSEKGPGFVRGESYVAGVAVATDDGYREYFPVRHEQGPNLDPKMVFKWLRKELGRANQPTVGANLLYDAESLHYEGVTIAGKWLDVLIAEPLLDENKLQYNLGSLAEEYLGEHKLDDGLNQWCADNFPRFNKKGHRMAAKATRKAQAKNYWRAPASVVGPYAIGDVDLPLRILPLQMKRLRAEQLVDLFELESSLLPLLLKMRVRGVRVDVAGAQALSVELERRIVQDKIALYRLAGKDVDVWAAASIAPVMDRMGISYPRTPKTQAPSFGADWFKVNRQQPVVAMIENVRKWEKFKTTFIDGYILGNHVRGRVHGQFHLLKAEENGTVSGRMSSSGPNLQNIPQRDEELGPLVRALFVPDEGEQWGSLDYSQIEYRCMSFYGKGPSADSVRALYANDPTTDFHQMTANLAGTSRKVAKSLGFGTSYGFGNQGLADLMGVSLEEGMRLKDAFNNMVPFISELSKDVNATAAARGFIRSVMNRRARFPLWESADFETSKREGWCRDRDEAKQLWGRIRRARTFTAFNRLIQGSAATLYKIGVRNAMEAGLFEPDALGAPLSFVHDETNVSVPQGREHLVTELKQCMEDAPKVVGILNVPFPAEAGIGANWAEAH